MGLFSSLLGSLGSSVFDGLASLGGSAFQYQRNKSLMKYQYELNQQSLRESPLATKEGLTSAGYNPMLALTGAVNAPSVGSSSVSAPDLRPDLNSGFTAFKQRELMEAQMDDVKSSADLKRTQAEVAVAQSAADIALKTAQAKKLNKESDSIAPEARYLRDFTGTVKDVATPVASAIGAKKGAEIASKMMRKAGIKNTVPYARAATSSAVANSAKAAAVGVGAASVPAALAVGAGLLGKKAQENARKNKTSSWRSYRSHTHHMSAGW